MCSSRRRARARTSRPLKTRLRPQLSSELSMLIAATSPMAPAPVCGTRPSRSISRSAGRRDGHDITTDGDEGHLHGEGNKAPEPVAERISDRERCRSIDHRGERDDHHGDGDEDEGVGNHFRPKR